MFAEDAPEEDAPRAAGGVIPVPVVQNSADFNVAVNLANGLFELARNIIATSSSGVNSVRSIISGPSSSL
ncbi:hypothetical protein GKC56_00420 [Neisseriaceae bacterium PsAf]|nr:hypothetical protein [Neisseriaceae bacterium PsAf]